MGICICCCCNKKTTDCLENTLIVFNAINISFYILGLILIDWKVLSSIVLIMNIIILLFLVFNITTLILVKIFRELETIYTTKRKLCYIFAYISMFLTIACFFLAVLVESVGSEKIYNYDHPCLDKYKENEKSNNRILTIYDEKGIEAKCKNEETDAFEYIKRSTSKDIIMSYICCSITEIFCLFGAFMWYNLIKRIKYCVKGKIFEGNGLINYGVLGSYIAKNNLKNKGKSTGKINGSEIIYVKNNMNTTKKTSNKNSFVTNNKKDNIINENNEISEQPYEESNNSNQEEENQEKIKEEKEPSHLSDDDFY
jgi:hypothetical protein